MALNIEVVLDHLKRMNHLVADAFGDDSRKHGCIQCPHNSEMKHQIVWGPDDGPIVTTFLCTRCFNLFVAKGLWQRDSQWVRILHEGPCDGEPIHPQGDEFRMEQHADPNDVSTPLRVHIYVRRDDGEFYYDRTESSASEK